MTNELLIGEADVARTFSDLLPVRRDQEVLFGQLVRTVAACEGFGCHARSIVLLDGGFLLKLGTVEALMAFAYPHSPRVAAPDRLERALVLIQMTLAGADVERTARRLALGNRVERLPHDVLPGPLWRYTGSFLASSERGSHATRSALTNDLQRVAAAHRLFLQQACGLVRGTRAGRSNPAGESIYQYAWTVCGERHSRKLGAGARAARRPGHGSR